MMKLWHVCALLTALALQGCGSSDHSVKPTEPTCEKNCGDFDYTKGDHQQCTVCHHVYDPRDGCLQCPSDSSKPCTTVAGCTSKKFEDLADDWRCPVCRQPKSVYQKVTVGEDVQWVDFDAEDGYTPEGGACKPIGTDGKALANPTSKQADFCHNCMVDKCAVSTPTVARDNASISRDALVTIV